MKIKVDIWYTNLDSYRCYLSSNKVAQNLSQLQELVVQA